MKRDEDQDMMNVLKYNQDRLDTTSEHDEKAITDMDKTMKDSKREDYDFSGIDSNMAKSLEILKKFAMVKPDLKEEEYTKKEFECIAPHDVPDQNFQELLDEANKAGYIDIKIEDILTPEEIADADARYQEIEDKFSAKTKLKKKDIILLITAVALQCIRQYALSNEKGRFKTDKDANGKVIKRSDVKGEEFMENTVGKIVPKKWNEVLFQSVPYDAVKKTAEFNALSIEKELGPRTHRYKTMGHDPILGWFFGPVNMLTDSLTKTDFVTTYRIENMQIAGYYKGTSKTAVPALSTVTAIKDALTLMENDKLLIPATIARQAVHFGSDMFTQQGLPLPFVSSINNDLSKDLLTKFHIDTYSVARGATLSLLINNIISCIHQLFYDERKDGSPELYEVRTRKVLLFSNLIATASNLIVVAITKNASKLDVGGIIVTIGRIFSDVRFITKVKDEFIHMELDKDIQKEIDEIDIILELTNESMTILDEIN